MSKWIPAALEDYSTGSYVNLDQVSTVVIVNQGELGFSIVAPQAGRISQHATEAEAQTALAALFAE